MIQQQFAHSAKTTLEPDNYVIGLVVAGSWLTCFSLAEITNRTF